MRRFVLLTLCLALALWCIGDPFSGPAGARAAEPEDQDQQIKVITGKVYAIDKALDLVMIDVGEEDGVQTLQDFVVWRGPLVIGHITITSVSPTASAGLIDKDRTFRRMKVGDMASVRVDQKKP